MRFFRVRAISSLAFTTWRASPRVETPPPTPARGPVGSLLVSSADHQRHLGCGELFKKKNVRKAHCLWSAYHKHRPHPGQSTEHSGGGGGCVDPAHAMLLGGYELQPEAKQDRVHRRSQGQLWHLHIFSSCLVAVGIKEGKYLIPQPIHTPNHLPDPSPIRPSIPPFNTAHKRLFLFLMWIYFIQLYSYYEYLSNASPPGCFYFYCHSFLHSVSFCLPNRLQDTLKELYLFSPPWYCLLYFTFILICVAPAFDWRKAKEMKADQHATGTAPMSAIHHIAHFSQP